MPAHLDRERIRTDVADVLGVAPARLGADDLLADHGLDSIRVLSLVERWQRAGVEVSFVDLVEAGTLADWWRLLSAA